VLHEHGREKAVEGTSTENHDSLLDPVEGEKNEINGKQSLICKFVQASN
jgi:hypothetical protein